MKDKGSTLVGEIKKQITNAEVWSYWRIVPTSVELTVRRLKWWQDISRHPGENQQVITSIFGILCDEDVPVLDHRGVFREDDSNFNFAAKTIKQDLLLLANTECGREFKSIWDPPIVKLLFGHGDNQAKDVFLLIEPCFLRAEFLAEKWAPFVNILGTSMPMPGDVECEIAEDDHEVHICYIEVEEGKKCGASFKSNRALLTHQRLANIAGHGKVRILHQLVLSNRCFNCSTVFRSKHAAGLHITRSWYAGRCIKNLTHQDYVYEPCALKCSVCFFQANTLPELDSHLLSHVPPTPKGSAIHVVERNSKQTMSDSQAGPSQPQRTARTAPRGPAYSTHGIQAEAVTGVPEQPISELQRRIRDSWRRRRAVSNEGEAPPQEH